MTPTPVLAEQVVALWGGFGGWLGMAYATYLHRSRDPVTPHIPTIFGIFAVGFSMLVTSAVMVTNPPEWVTLFAVGVAYSLLILAETVMFALDAYPDAFEEFQVWLSPPRFVHPNQLAETQPESESHE